MHLKPESLLLDENFNLKLSDFRYSTFMNGADTGSRMKALISNDNYMAPEYLMKSSNIQGSSADIFASGIILFIFIAGHVPFNFARPKDQLYNMLCTNRHEKFWQYHSKKKPSRDQFFSTEFKDLMNGIFSLDYKKRPTIEEILAHPWCNGAIATPEEILKDFQDKRLTVDQFLEKEKNLRKRIKEEHLKNKENNTSPNFAYQKIAPSFRSSTNRDLEYDDYDNYDSEWAEIEQKFVDCEFPSIPIFKPIYYKPGCIYISSMDTRTFILSCYYICVMLGTCIQNFSLQNYKIRISKNLDIGNVELELRI